MIAKTLIPHGVGAVIPGTDEVAELELPRFQRALADTFHDREGFGTAWSTKSFAIIEILS
jgi:hypothetical protein